jgi:hypothetical protein
MTNCDSHISSVSVSGKEGIVSIGEERLDVVEASDLKLLRLLLDDLPMQRVHQRRRVQQEGTVGEVDVALTDRSQVVLGERGLEMKMFSLKTVINSYKIKI